jgi:hypothetical protein
MGYPGGVVGTTIKVPSDLRDRINAEASERGLTAAGLLAELLDDYERAQRLAAAKEAMAGGMDEEYWAEFAAWDAIAADRGR